MNDNRKLSNRLRERRENWILENRNFILPLMGHKSWDYNL
jgi:hypothetical protein